MLFGIILFIIGLSFLLRNLGIITDVTWSFIWPIAVMLIGLSMIFKKTRW
jgi:membrane-bound ClpP family serine protease